CYPNPFNNSTILKYYIPSSANVKIDLYNVVGQSVISIFNDFISAGYHKQKIELKGLSSGVYFVVVNISNQKLVNKIIYLK
ncbi:MAG: T9SS type A sorting domain-containing protein, partial [Ignavibacteriaceae bacterium]|nr:T9SS type A sorting domain-containing protein [Ignavibacteriaceae bacterium]